MILHQKSSPIPPDGIVLHNSFQVSQHRSSRLESALILLGQALIILTGLIGAGYTFLTSFSITHYPLILLPFLLFCTLYWTFLLTRKSPFWTLLGLALPLLPAFFLLSPIREGFVVTANCIVHALNQQMNWNLYDYVTTVPPYQFAYVSTLFYLFASTYFSFLLCWAVIRMHSFLLVFLLTLPFLFGLFFLFIPSYLPILMLISCWMALFSMYPVKIRRKKTGKTGNFTSLPHKKVSSFVLSEPKIIHPVMIKSGAILMCSTLLCVCLLFFCFPKSHYQRSDQMNQLKSDFVTGIQNLITRGEFSTDGIGGLSTGKLNQLGNVSFRRLPALKIRTDCPDPMYLRGWIGSEYNENQWTNSDALSQHYQSEVASHTFSIPQFQIASFLSKYGDQTDGSPYHWVGELEYIHAQTDYIYTPYTTSNLSLSNKRVFYIEDREIRTNGEIPNHTYQFSFYSPHDNYFYHAAGSEGLESSDFFPQLYLGSSNSPGLFSYQNQEQAYQRYVYETYTQLPDHAREVAQRFLDESTLTLPTDPSAYDPLVTQDVIRQVTNYLTSNYVYTLSPGSTPSDEDFVEYFLFENKKGYCSHFASATAVILRSLGIPTRYVEGYVVTESDIQLAGTGSVYQYEYVINDTNAHAWVEVYQDKVGWIPFETTPGYAGLQQINLTGEAGTQGNAGNVGANNSQFPYPELNLESSAASSSESSSYEPLPSSEAVSSAPSVSSSSSSTINFFSLPPQWRLAVMLIGLALLLMAATVGVLYLRQKLVYRQRKKAFHSTSANERAKKYFQYLWKVFDYDGFPNQGKSLLQYAEQAAQHYPFIDQEEMMKIAHLALKASYSKEALSPEELDHIACFTMQTARRIYQKYPFWKRIIFKYIHNLY